MYRSNSQSEVIFQKLHKPSKREKDPIEAGYKHNASKVAASILVGLNSGFGMPSYKSISPTNYRFSTINETPSSRYDYF